MRRTDHSLLVLSLAFLTACSSGDDGGAVENPIGPTLPPAPLCPVGGELSLAEHLATPLDPELVAWASLILTMGPQHADSAESLGGHGKVWMLTAFSDGGEDTRGPGVPDPFGGDAEDYLECFRALEGLVEAALGRVEADFIAPKKEAAQ